MCPSFCCETHSRRRHHSLTAHASLHAYEVSNKHTFTAVEADRGQLLSSRLSIHTAAVNIIHQPVQTDSAQRLMQKFP